VRDVTIEHLTIDGNRETNALLTGCRGAGIFLYCSHGTRISWLHRALLPWGRHQLSAVR
jgi:hypothetical protein